MKDGAAKDAQDGAAKDAQAKDAQAHHQHSGRRKEGMNIEQEAGMLCGHSKRLA